MNTAELLFWSLAITIIYTYLGYGLFLWILTKIKSLLSPKKIYNVSAHPTVTLIIPAYNEKDILLAKLSDCQQLNYPKDNLEIWFVTDGSNDGSEQLLNEYTNTRVKVFHQAKRAGKMAAMNRIMPIVQSEITVFSDANTFLNSDAIKNIVLSLQDTRVACVAGEKRVHSSNTAGKGEGLYWKYESKLKSWSSDLYSTIGAAGELFAIRTNLFTPPPKDTILDDFIISLDVIRKGHKIAYVPDAYALETGSLSLEEEFKRKTRICAGGLQSIARTFDLLNPIKYPLFAWMYLSHRVLRWTVTPLALLLVLFINLQLLDTGAWIYILSFCVQVLFYSLATIGWLRRKNSPSFIFLVPCYFTMMNLAVFWGFGRFLRKKQSVLWEKTLRYE
ncbi:MAG: glycosyltransferase family 2 protein [Saprospiraceae bacterium]|nr:glycosyltransferase family 2 protein [Saprospiraceae bacterium]